MKKSQLEHLVRQLVVEYQINEQGFTDDGIRKYLAQALKIDPEDVAMSPEEAEKPIQNSDVDEAVIATALTIAGLVPLVMTGLGKLINTISRKYQLSDEQKAEYKKLENELEIAKKQLKDADKQAPGYTEKEKEIEGHIEHIKHEMDQFTGSVWGASLVKGGHAVHETYIKGIEKLLQGIAWTYKKLTRKKLKIEDEHTRRKAANIIYAVIMVTAAGTGIASHLGHIAGIGPALTSAVEGVKGGLSAAEIIKDLAVIT